MSNQNIVLGVTLGAVALLGIGFAMMGKKGTQAEEVQNEYNDASESRAYTVGGTRRKNRNRNKSKRK